MHAALSSAAAVILVLAARIYFFIPWDKLNVQYFFSVNEIWHPQASTSTQPSTEVSSEKVPKAVAKFVNPEEEYVNDAREHVAGWALTSNQ